MILVKSRIRKCVFKTCPLKLATLLGERNLTVTFQDLSSTHDAERERVFLVCQIIRVGRMDLKDVESKKQAKGMRRPFGVAAIELTELFRGDSDSDEEKQSFIPFLQ